MISIPNIYRIIVGHRFRTSGNDLLVKTRWVRSVAIAKRRRLDMIIHSGNQTLEVLKPAHTEYDLLKDIAKAISTSASAFPNLSSFILYEEDSDTLETFEIGDANDNAVDVMTTTCTNDTISFNPSGTLSETCEIAIKNTRTNGQVTLKLYKGGQTILR